MTTITLEVSDELAHRLRPVQQHLPELLSLAAHLYPRGTFRTSPVSEAKNPAAEILDFLVNKPTPEQILAFECSPTIQAYLEELLEKNRMETLTEEEEAELDEFQQVNHFFILLKAHARALPAMHMGAAFFVRRLAHHRTNPDRSGNKRTSPVQCA